MNDSTDQAPTDPQPSLDRLAEMFQLQNDLQINAYGASPSEITDPKERISFIKDMHIALTDELHEALAETGWKPWTSSWHVNEEAFKGELVDAWHFFMNLCLAVSMTPDELFEKYKAKRTKNQKRQDEGYDGVSTKCPQCKRALDDDAVDCYEVLTNQQAENLGLGITTINPLARVFFCSSTQAVHAVMPDTVHE